TFRISDAFPSNAVVDRQAWLGSPCVLNKGRKIAGKNGRLTRAKELEILVRPFGHEVVEVEERELATRAIAKKIVFRNEMALAAEFDVVIPEEVGKVIGYLVTI